VGTLDFLSLVLAKYQDSPFEALCVLRTLKLHALRMSSEHPQAPATIVPKVSDEA
jgi:hypothetical protein